MKYTEKLVVLIPHFNQRTELEQTLRSITFAEPLSVIIVDDGSNEHNTLNNSWIRSLDIPFSIEVINLTKNSGITVALNTGLQLIFKTSSRYIARLDCGDYNAPARLDVQHDFMERNPDVALCGSWAEIVNDQRMRLYTVTPPVTPDQIVRRMQSGNCFVHPTVMMRTQAAREIGYYPEGFPAAEDYGYFFKFVNRYKTANIPAVLVYKTRDAKSISYRNRTAQLMSRLKIILLNWKFRPESFLGIVKTLLLMVIPTSIVERAKEKFSG